MGLIIGIGLALVVSIMATCVGFDRDRSFYPVVMIVIAFIYGLFAVMSGVAHVLAIEMIGIVLFVLVSIVGFKLNLWWVAAALFGHGVFDFFHDHFVANPGVPAWWPMFCMAYDVTAAAYLAWLLCRSKLIARPGQARR